MLENLKQGESSYELKNMNGKYFDASFNIMKSRRMVIFV